MKSVAWVRINHTLMLLAWSACLLPGCTITRSATAVRLPENQSRELCVVEDPAVDDSFLPAFKQALEKKRFVVRLLPSGSQPSVCPITATYVGRWSWDFVTYMSYARIVVYRDGVIAGEALYDAPKAGWSMTTDIYESTDSKIDKMVDGLFPTSFQPSA